MAEIVLKRRSALGGYARDWPTARLAEIEGRALAWLAGPPESGGGIVLPGPGQFATADGVSAFWIGPDQWLLAADGYDLPARLRATMDQSDAWASLRLSGPGAPAALERFCPLDLDALPTGAVARTVMEHIDAVIAREDDAPTFLLMTPRSSARSFLHALETALNSTLR